MESNWINMSQLSILGIPETYLHIALILCGLFIIYLFIEPICSWLIIKGCSKTISYFISTLIMMIVFMAFLLFNDSFQQQLKELMKVTFLSFSIYGFFLAAYHFVKMKLNRKRRKVY